MPATGVEREGGLGLPEWWRVVELDPLLRRQMHFVDEGTAEEFALYLAAEQAGLVVLEHWRAGRRIDYRLVVAETGRERP